VAGGKRLPADMLQQFVEKTDGVPLYVEEMTKAVLESGLLKEADGQYELTGPFSSLSIPTTLQDSLMARLDRLVTAKAVAQYASVIGRQFSYELLQAVSQLDEVMLQHELTRLVEAELVYQRSVIPQATYIFKHALIQDTAYESLLRSTRQGYHHRIAEVLEERFPEMVERQPELLAHHYTEAKFHEPAVSYWHQAGERAIQRFAYVEAIAHLTKGLEVLTTFPDTNERAWRELALQTLLSIAVRDARGFAVSELEAIYTRQQALCQQLGETQQLVSVLWFLRTFYLTRVEYQKAIVVGEKLLALSQHTTEPRVPLVAHTALGPPLLNLGKITTAHAHLEQGIALYEAHRSHFLSSDRWMQDVGVCLNWLSQSLWLLGYPDQALHRMQERLSLAERSSSFSRALALVKFATRLHQCRREIDATGQRAGAGLALCVERGFTGLVSTAMIHYGWVLAMQGRHEEGIEQIRQGIITDEKQEVQVQRPFFLCTLVEAYAKAGKASDGLDTIAEALAVVNETGERWYEAELHRLKGSLLLQQSPDNHTEAETCFHQAIAIAQSQQAKSWELRAATSLATLWQSQGKRQDAYDLLAPVYEWFTEGFDTADLKDAKILLDELGG
jgi:predicted ATPase